MGERGDGLGFLLEVLGLLVSQMGMQHLDGGLLIEPQVLAQVDLGIAALSQQGDQAVVAKLLSSAIRHLRPPNVQLEASTRSQVDRSFEETHVYCKGNTGIRQVSVRLNSDVTVEVLHTVAYSMCGEFTRGW